jgi:hypothetical protein
MTRPIFWRANSFGVGAVWECPLNGEEEKRDEAFHLEVALAMRLRGLGCIMARWYIWWA